MYCTTCKAINCMHFPFQMCWKLCSISAISNVSFYNSLVLSFSNPSFYSHVFFEVHSNEMGAKSITSPFYLPACTNYILLSPLIVRYVSFSAFPFYANITVLKCKCKIKWSEVKSIANQNKCFTFLRRLLTSSSPPLRGATCEPGSVPWMEALLYTRC